MTSPAVEVFPSVALPVSLYESMRACYMKPTTHPMGQKLFAGHSEEQIDGYLSKRWTQAFTPTTVAYVVRDNEKVEAFLFVDAVPDKEGLRRVSHVTSTSLE